MSNSFLSASIQDEIFSAANAASHTGLGGQSGMRAIITCIHYAVNTESMDEALYSVEGALEVALMARSIAERSAHGRDPQMKACDRVIALLFPVHKGLMQKRFGS